MSADPLEYLRDRDPVPQGSTAPPMEWVLAHIEGAAARPVRRRLRLPVVPMMAVAATLAVVALIIVLAVTHHGAAPAHVPPATRTVPAVHTVPSPQSLMPRGGMRGTLSIGAAASASPDDVVLSFSQCRPCRANGAGSTNHLWQMRTTNGGASWTVKRTSAQLAMLDLAGADGWAEGVGPDSLARFFVSHDGGRAWHVASSADGAPGGVGDVSIAAGEVWTLGSHCGSGCAGTNPPGPPTDVVLRAPASGSHLSETAGQPPLGDTTNVSVVATGRDDAYAFTDDYGHDPQVATIAGTRLFATHDGGRTWRRMTAACPARDFGRLYAGGAALWALCAPLHGPALVHRSIDGGRHWTPLQTSPSSFELQPASATVAWAVTAGGRVLRTTDGGRAWSEVWEGGRSRATPPPNAPAGLNRAWSTILTAQSAATATVIVGLTRGHGRAARSDFVTYRTADGGRTWRPGVIRLPPG